MVKGMGEMSLEAIYTWFPKRDKDELKGEIINSKTLSLEGNIVRYVNDKKNKVKEVSIIEKDIDLKGKIITKVKEDKVNVEVKVEKESIVNDIKFSCGDDSIKSLMESIDKYNTNVEARLEELNKLDYGNKAKAIKKYYEERFIIEDSETIKGKNYEFITLKHKQKGVEIAYLLISDIIKKNLIDEIYNNHKYDTVYFCQLNEESPNEELPLGEYYYKNCNELICNYMSKYKLVKKNVEIYDIVEE